MAGPATDLLSELPEAGDVALLAAEVRVMVGRLRRRLREEARVGGLTPSQTAVLGSLERQGPLTVTALARLEGVRPQSLGATVASLEELGLLSGAPDPSDGRQTLWTPTAACHALIQTRRAAREDWLARAMQATFSAEQRAEVARAVALLGRLADADRTDR